MKKINISTKKHPNTYALVDDEDYEYINQWRWYCASGYAVRMIRLNGKRMSIGMHKVINKTPNGMYTDHINRIPLDNRKCNLRTCTFAQNMQNRIGSNKTSQYKGVWYRADREKWTCRIKKDGIKYNLGCYKTEKEAAIVYNKKARLMFGEFAYLNKIDE